MAATFRRLVPSRSFSHLSGKRSAAPDEFLKVRNIYIDTILDSSTKVNIITRSLVDKARLTM